MIIVDTMFVQSSFQIICYAGIKHRFVFVGEDVNVVLMVFFHGWGGIGVLRCCAPQDDGGLRQDDGVLRRCAPQDDGVMLILYSR